jgi:hypothetical protein
VPEICGLSTRRSVMFHQGVCKSMQPRRLSRHYLLPRFSCSDVMAICGLSTRRLVTFHQGASKSMQM